MEDPGRLPRGSTPCISLCRIVCIRSDLKNHKDKSRREIKTSQKFLQTVADHCSLDIVLVLLCGRKDITGVRSSNFLIGYLILKDCYGSTLHAYMANCIVLIQNLFHFHISTTNISRLKIVLWFNQQNEGNNCGITNLCLTFIVIKEFGLIFS